MGLLKIGNVVIFGPCLRWADMRQPGQTTLTIAIGGDQYSTVVLEGDDDREFRRMFEEGGPSAGMMQAGSRMEN